MEINGDVTMETTNKQTKSENRASQPFDTRTADFRNNHDDDDDTHRSVLTGQLAKRLRARYWFVNHSPLLEKQIGDEDDDDNGGDVDDDDNDVDDDYDDDNNDPLILYWTMDQANSKNKGNLHLHHHHDDIWLIIMIGCPYMQKWSLNLGSNNRSSQYKD